MGTQLSSWDSEFRSRTHGKIDTEEMSPQRSTWKIGGRDRGMPGSLWPNYPGVDIKNQETLPHKGWTERTNSQGCTLNSTYVMACIDCTCTQIPKILKFLCKGKGKNTKARKMNEIQLLATEWMISALLNQRNETEKSTYMVWFYLYKV